MSGYNYAENMVPMAIDLWGLQAKVVFYQSEPNLQATWTVERGQPMTFVDAVLFEVYTKGQKWGPNSTVIVSGTADEIFSGKADVKIEYDGFLDSWTPIEEEKEGITIWGLGLGADEPGRKGTGDKEFDFAEFLSALPANSLGAGFLKRLKFLDPDLAKVATDVLNGANATQKGYTATEMGKKAAEEMSRGGDTLYPCRDCGDLHERRGNGLLYPVDSNEAINRPVSEDSINWWDHW